MKKLALTIAIVLGLSMSTFADPNGGGMFQRGGTSTEVSNNRGGMPGLPGHGESDNQSAPLGTGAVVLLGLGAAYLIGKKRNERL